MVIRALAELREEGLAVGYVCAGDGEERCSLKDMADKLDLTQWVHFPGEVTEHDKKLIYGASDIFAMPSIQVGEMIEGFGIVFLEAAAAGLPSICGNTGGQTEAVLHGKTGIVVDGTSLVEVCRAIRSLVKQPQIRTELGRQARTWAEKHDWANVVEQTRAAIGGALSGR